MRGVSKEVLGIVKIVNKGGLRSKLCREVRGSESQQSRRSVGTTEHECNGSEHT